MLIIFRTLLAYRGGHSLTWAQQRILFTQILKVVESNFDQGCIIELTFIFLNIYTAVVDTKRKNIFFN
jgi:hypothetical protein